MPTYNAQSIDVPREGCMGTWVMNFPMGTNGIFFGHSDISLMPNLGTHVPFLIMIWMLDLPTPETNQAALGHDVFCVVP